MVRKPYGKMYVLQEFQHGKETVQTTTNKSTPMVEGIRLEKKGKILRVTLIGDGLVRIQQFVWLW